MTAERTNKDWIGLFVVDTRSPADCGSIPVPVHEHKAGPVLVATEIVRAAPLGHYYLSCFICLVAFGAVVVASCATSCAVFVAVSCAVYVAACVGRRTGST